MNLGGAIWVRDKRVYIVDADEAERARLTQIQLAQVVTLLSPSMKDRKFAEMWLSAVLPHVDTAAILGLLCERTEP